MHGNVFDHHDRVINDQPDRRRKSAQGHQVEALPGDPEKENRYCDGDRNDEACDQRGSPIAKKEKEDDAGEDQANENRVADAQDAFADQLRLVVECLELNPRGQLRLQLIDLRRYAAGNSNRIARGLAGDVQQDRRFAIRRDRGVDRHSRGLDGGDVCHTNRRAPA